MNLWFVVAARVCSDSAYCPPPRAYTPAPGVVASAGRTVPAAPDNGGLTGIARVLRGLRSSTISTVYSATTSQWMWGNPGPYPWD